MKAMTLRNEFHNSETTIRPREDGTISAGTYRRAGQALCGITGCRCSSSPASGPDMLVLGQAEPVYEGCRIVAWRLPRDLDL